MTVCDAWRTSFQEFFAHVGPRPSDKHTLDRIDVNVGYEPGNVRWATRQEQNNNRSTTRKVEHAGRVMSVTQFAAAIGDPSAKRRVLRRLATGWSAAEATTTRPLDRAEYSKLGRAKLYTYNGKRVAIHEAIDMSGIKVARTTVYQRMVEKGWSLEDAIHTPVDKRKSRAG